MPIMPDLYGLLLQEAEGALTAAGVLNTQALGYFGIWPIKVQWSPVLTGPFTADSVATADSSVPVDEVVPLTVPGTVVNQSIPAGNSVAVNAALLLTVIQFPLSVAYP